MGLKSNLDLVFTTSGGEKVQHMGVELQKLAEHFGRTFTVTPTLNRKQKATSIGQSGSDVDVRATAAYMSHSLTKHAPIDIPAEG